jgi:hypothetical protein
MQRNDSNNGCFSRGHASLLTNTLVLVILVARPFLHKVFSVVKRLFMPVGLSFNICSSSLGFVLVSHLPSLSKYNCPKERKRLQTFLCELIQKGSYCYFFRFHSALVSPSTIDSVPYKYRYILYSFLLHVLVMTTI